MKGLERLTNFSRRRANVQKTVFGDRSILWYKFLGTTLKNQILPDKNPCRSEPISGRDFYTDFFIPYRKGDVLMWKNKKLNIVFVAYALTPFRSVVVFISDFFAPFFRKTVNFSIFVSLDIQKDFC